MPLLARRAASATERTLVYFRMTMYMRPPCVSVPAPRIKAYRAAAGLGPTSEMGQSLPKWLSARRPLILKSFTFVPQPKFNGDPLLIKRERCLITDAPYRHFSSCHFGEG